MSLFVVLLFSLFFFFLMDRHPPISTRTDPLFPSPTLFRSSQAAGGPPFVIRELLKAGLLHRDILTVAGDDLGAYGRMPEMDGDTLIWRDLPDTPIDDSIVRTVAAPLDRKSTRLNSSH